MADFGELVLVLGDLHIPSRANELPDAFKDLLVPGKMQHILCTGNLVNKHTEEYLRTLANSVHIVKGDCDVNSALIELPESKSIRIGDFTIGLIHGHQIIPWGDLQAAQSIQRSLNCDILISGHTHSNQVVEVDGKYFINPGSATGAYNGFVTQFASHFTYTYTSICAV
jgi:vacuolar protein sorting-associated protein 29